MKIAHHVLLSVFSKEEEEHKELAQKLVDLIPLDIAKEKIELKKQAATGFNQKKIRIFEIALTKDRHIKAFLDFLKQNLNKEQKQSLINQAETRLDEDMHFFIRFDKDQWMKEDKLWITDSGNCFHVNMTMAAYPAKRKIALSVLKELFK